MTHENFSLHGLLFIHQAMRRDTVRLAQRAARRPSKTEVASMARWFARFRHQLEEHHHLEDEMFFPMLRERDGSLGAGFATLEGDHREMAALLERVAAGLAAGGGSELVEASAGLAALIRYHLDAEEALVVPAVSRLMSLAEQRVFEEGLRKRSSLAEIGFALPWILSVVSPDERAGVLAELPLLLRWLYRAVWRGSYERLDAGLDAREPPAVVPAASVTLQ